MKKYLLILIGVILLMIPNGCSKTGIVEVPYIDPHIIFTPGVGGITIFILLIFTEGI